jgi:hypothetical protein
LLSDEEASWTDLLRFRYGHFPTLLLGGAASNNRNKESIWWRDIIDTGKGLAEDWFRSNVGCNVGNGRNIGFWTFKWYGNQPLKNLFPTLFAKEVVPDISVADRMHTSDSNTNWAWQWSNQLSEEEHQQLQELSTLLADISLSPDRLDSWRWIPGTTGTFSVKSCYSFLLDSRQSEAIEADVLEAIKKLWRNDLPSKVLVFGWRLLLDRLPTKGALHRRGILINPSELNCIFCHQHLEDNEHLFFNCPVIISVWESVYHWIGRRVVTGAAVVDGRHHFSRFGNLFRYPKGGRINHLIWLVTTWCVWNLRNQVVFKGAIPNVSALVDDIKRFSWLWFNGRFARNSCITFSDWCQDPMGSLNSS